MKRTLLTLTLLALCGTAMAADTIRIGHRVLSVGDSTGTVVSVAGKPDNTVQLENRYGGAVAQRWEYYRNSKTILITVHDGRVTQIDQVDG